MSYSALEPTKVTDEASSSVFIDLVFPIEAKIVPIHHGYLLYAAICHSIGAAHNTLNFKLLTIAGQKMVSGELLLPQNTSLKIRTPAENIPAFLSLAGKQLQLENRSLRLGIPKPYLLKPSSKLYSRIVIIKGYTEENAFEEALKRQLEVLNVNAIVELPKQADGNTKRRILKIKGQQIVGFSVLLRGLSAEDSIKIQESGLGGKQKMGAGFFVPIKG